MILILAVTWPLFLGWDIPVLTAAIKDCLIGVESGWVEFPGHHFSANTAIAELLKNAPPFYLATTRISPKIVQKQAQSIHASQFMA